METRGHSKGPAVWMLLLWRICLQVAKETVRMDTGHVEGAKKKRNVGRGVWWWCDWKPKLIDGARCSFFLSLIVGNVPFHYDSTCSSLLLLLSQYDKVNSWYMIDSKHDNERDLLKLDWYDVMGSCIMCVLSNLSFGKGSKDLTETMMIINQWADTWHLQQDDEKVKVMSFTEWSKKWIWRESC